MNAKSIPRNWSLACVTFTRSQVVGQAYIYIYHQLFILPQATTKAAAKNIQQTVLLSAPFLYHLEVLPKVVKVGRMHGMPVF